LQYSAKSTLQHDNNISETSQADTFIPSPHLPNDMNRAFDDVDDNSFEAMKKILFNTHTRIHIMYVYIHNCGENVEL